jgi:hypothetical protein
MPQALPVAGTSSITTSGAVRVNICPMAMAPGIMVLRQASINALRWFWRSMGRILFRE